MSDRNKAPRTQAPWREENEELRRRLEEAEQTLEAIRCGEVDALVVIGPESEQVYSLTGAEHVYRVIVETMNEAALTVAPDGTILFCNQRFCDLMKTPMDDVMGHKLATFAARPQQPSLDTLLANAQAGPVQQHLTLRATDGTVVPAQLSAGPLQAGDHVSVCFVVTDLTELEASAGSIRVLREHEQEMQEANARLQAQSEQLQIQAEALRRSEEKYRTLFESIDEGFCLIEVIFDEAGRPVDYRFLETNPAFERHTGLHEVQGQRIRALAPDHEAHWFEIYGRIALTGEPARFANEAKTLHRWYDVYAFRIGEPEQHRVAVLFNDITERQRSEETLRELTATLENKVAQRTAELKHRARQLQKLALEMSEAEDRERERIAHILHDDLQQELAAAKFHLSIVRSRIKHDASIREITANVDEMLKDAIGKSRSLSHELSPGVLHQDEFAEILQWLANEVQAKHGLAVHVQGQAHCPSAGIKAFLYRTAQELLFNAVKHAQVKEARVRVRQCGGYICLSVSDRGRGFDPGKLREAAGFGLLSIRERIELLGGRMKIRSAPGEGSTFFVVVPDGGTAEVDSEAERRLTGQGKGAGHALDAGESRLRVLLADDHEVVRQGLAALLSDEDAVEIVGEAANGREAVDLADQLHPDVVIMDMSMPVMSGDEATRRIKSQSPQTRVVALSMFEDAEVRDKMYQAGAESYVLKTAPSEELLAAVRGAVAGAPSVAGGRVSPGTSSSRRTPRGNTSKGAAKGFP